MLLACRSFDSTGDRHRAGPGETEVDREGDQLSWRPLLDERRRCRNLNFVLPLISVGEEHLQLVDAVINPKWKPILEIQHGFKPVPVSQPRTQQRGIATRSADAKYWFLESSEGRSSRSE